MGRASLFELLLRRAVIGTCLFLLPNLARCETLAAASDVGDGRRIQINLVAEVGSIPDLNPLLIEWFGSQRPSLEFRYVPALRSGDVLASSAEPRLLRIWLVLYNSRLARVYFAEASGQRFLVRDVPLRNGLDEFGRRNLAQVVVTSATAFSQHSVSSTVSEVVQTFQKPVDPATPLRDSKTDSQLNLASDEHRTEWFLRAGALYGIYLEQSAAISHGPGLLVGAGQQGAHAIWLYSLKFQYRWPLTVEGSQIALTSHTLALRTTAVVEAPFGSHLMGGLELGAGFDRVSFEATALPGANIAARSGDVQYKPVLASGLRASLKTDAAYLTLLIGFTAALVKTHFDVVHDAQSQIEYRPWLVQPYSAIEASWQ